MVVKEIKNGREGRGRIYWQELPSEFNPAFQKFLQLFFPYLLVRLIVVHTRKPRITDTSGEQKLHPRKKCVFPGCQGVSTYVYTRLLPLAPKFFTLRYSDLQYLALSSTLFLHLCFSSLLALLRFVYRLVS